jgi:hypothetical protein
LSEAAFQNVLLAGRIHRAAEDELRSKRVSTHLSAVEQTELKLSGLTSPRSSDPTGKESSLQKTEAKKSESLIVETGGELLIPVVLDQCSLPNTPDPTQSPVFESPVLGFKQHVPQATDPETATPKPKEPTEPTTPQSNPVPVAHERNSSLGRIAKEAKEVLGQRLSLRSRRKNSRTNSGMESPVWKLEDIPRRRSAIIDLPPATLAEVSPPPTTSPEVSAEVPSPPVSPPQFQLRKGSGSEVSSPVSLNFDGKNTPPTTVATNSLPSMSPPVPTRHPDHHSPKQSVTVPFQSPQREEVVPAVPDPEVLDPEVPVEEAPSRRSSVSSDIKFKASHNSISPQLPSLQASGSMNFEDELSKVWLQHELPKPTTNHSHTPSASSTNGQRHRRGSSVDQKLPSRQLSKSKTFTPPEEETSIPQGKLRKSTQQIVELELKVQEDEAEVLAAEDRLESAREAFMGVETEREMTLKELKVLLKHRYALQNNKSLRTEETCERILRDFEDSLEKLKDQMRQQITEYTAVKTGLVEETTKLRALRDNYLEEATQLNRKNDELADLNNDIQRNMDRAPAHQKSSSGFSIFKSSSGGYHRGHAQSPTAVSISSVQSTVFKNDLAHPMYFEPQMSGDTPVTDSPNSRISDSTVIMDEPKKAVVTRVIEPNDIPAPKKFNWKMNTSQFKKNAVKGLKSVWSGDTNVLVSSPITISAPQLITPSSSLNSGLNISLSSSVGSDFSDLYKSHSFHPKTFKRWHKCLQCNEKLSGTELRCTGTTLTDLLTL